MEGEVVTGGKGGWTVRGADRDGDSEFANTEMAGAMGGCDFFDVGKFFKSLGNEL